MPHLVRDADGDLLLFIHEGAGDLFCDFGHLSYREGDYILLPRGTMWRLEPTAATTACQIEARNGGYKLPDRGLLGPHAQFDPATLGDAQPGRCVPRPARRRMVGPGETPRRRFPPSAIRSIRWMRWAGKAIWRR